MTSYLVAYATVLATVLAMLMLVMIVELSGGAWFTAVRRYAETVIATLPVLAVLFIPILIGGRGLYLWAGTPAEMPSALRHAVEARQPYLSPLFAALRAIMYWIVWISVGERLRDASTRYRQSPDDLTSLRLHKLSAIGIPLIAITMTFASFDWLMSLSPDWSSSIYGMYYFAGGAAAAVALLAVMRGIAIRRSPQSVAGQEDFRALANLLLTFILLWVYLAYSQFLIIWIADLPREVPWYEIRTRGGWGALGLVLVIGHFVLPFLALLLQAVKRSALGMVVVGGWILLMHYLDIYWLVVPAQPPRQLLAYLMDLAALVAVAGLAFGVAFRRQSTSTTDTGMEYAA